MRINTNISALNAQRNLVATNSALGKSLERLSSGLRINRAADDAAGLAVSEKLRAQVSGFTQAMRNASDGISLVQTAEGALNEVHAILQRMRTLANQAANSTLADADRVQITAEFTQLRTELDRISASVEFNGTALLDGTATGLTIQVGADGTANSRITFDISAVSVAGLGIAASAVDTIANAQTAITAVGTAIETVATNRASLGAVQNRLESTVNNLGVSVENLSAAQSRIRDADMAAEMVQFTRSQILLQAGTAMLAQANAAPQSVLQLLQG